jgi:Spy/CpxP family protein refolding chaperone
MNTLTRRLLALSVAGAVTVGVGAAVAQNAEKPAKPEGRAGRRMGHRMHFQALNLTEDQKAKVKELHQKARQSRSEIQASTATPEEKKAQFQALRKEQREAFQQVLTQEQRDKMAEMRKNRAGKGMGRMGRAGRMGRFGRFGMRGNGFGSMANLNLTDEQKAKIQAAREQFQAQMQSILTPEQLQKMQSTQGRRGMRGVNRPQPKVGDPV